MFMDRSSQKGLWILGVVALLIAYTAVPVPAQYADEGMSARDRTSQRSAVPSLGSDTALRRATKLLGRPLKNTLGATLGTVNDLVLTPDLDRVSYAVISRGGLFGFGNRLYAVPWPAMQAGLGDTIVAPIDVRELDQDRGFHTTQWPSQGDPRWLGRAGERTEVVTYDVQPVTEQEKIRLRRVKHILGMTARGPDDDRVGTIKDMVIALDSGRIPFTIVSFGGLLGLGTRYTAVPADTIELHPDDYMARIQVDEQILQANAFSPGSFPDLSDPIYSRRLYTAYDVNPRDPDWTVLGYIPAEEPARTAPQGTSSAPSRSGVQPMTPPSTRGPTPIPGLETRQTPATGQVQNEYLSVFTPGNMRTLEGVVTGVSSFEIVGTDAEWVQLQVRTDAGNLATVHLGPRDYVSQQDFYVAANDRISLTGAQATAWRQPIILPVTATVSGRTITLRDQSGRPLWIEAATGGQSGAQATPSP